MIALVGYTGFVGSNIYKEAGDEIGAIYNTKNIEKAFGTNPDLLIYAGLRAEKYLANNAPEKDRELIIQAEDNITRIDPKKLVLISTIDVFKNPKNVDEKSEVAISGLHAYGYNRYQLELWVREKYPDALIIRLPGLFGRNIRKNFIYDFMNVIPFMIKESTFEELLERDHDLKKFYKLQDNGFYQVNVSDADRGLLKDKFTALNFTALNFTDSRSIYQFYHLKRLWQDIRTALDAGITLWHSATEPISVGELYKYLTGKDFVNELNGIPAEYDYKTVHAEIFGGKDGYICRKQEILAEIEKFMKEEKEDAQN